MQFSANLGFLWTELDLPDAIAAASKAGFAAVECHWPYAIDATQLRSVLQQHGIPMLGINSARGGDDEFGLCALPQRQSDAQRSIDEAVAYAHIIGAKYIHVMAGKANGEQARAVFIANLAYACQRAAAHGIDVLIEPLNSKDVPGYFLNRADQACAIIDQLAQPNLKLLFDIYHMQLIGGNLSQTISELFPLIGHIQIAAAPHRGAPMTGEVNDSYIIELLTKLGWQKPIGAEYLPAANTNSTLDWLAPLSRL